MASAACIWLPSLAAGRLPSGAIVGRNSFGETRYSVCPPPGASHTFITLVDPLPDKTSVKPGFDSAALLKEAEESAGREGQLFFSYGRH